MTELQTTALKIIKNLRKKGWTLEKIARSLRDEISGYEGPSVWSVQRWLKGKNKISETLANKVFHQFK